MKKIPASLRYWFFTHFLADMIFAIPLFINPTWTLRIFGITVESVTARLVAAALFGIGKTSFLTYHKTIESFKTMATSG